MTTHTLGSAAKATGVAKSTIYRAIKSGRISATRTDTKDWAIDPAELHRVFPPAATPDSVPVERGATDAAHAELNQRASVADQRLSELKVMLDDMRQDRDHWRDAFRQEQTVTKQLALAAPMTTPAPAPAPAARSWWWRRAG